MIQLEKPKLPSNYESATWARLLSAINAVHQDTPIKESLEGLYKVHSSYLWFLFRCVSTFKFLLNTESISVQKQITRMNTHN